MTFTNQIFKQKACKTCSSVFTPSNPCTLYCSLKCRGKNAYYLRNYGLDEKGLEELKKKQDYKCKICNSEGFLIGKNNHTEKLAVDHCHTTKKVRGLLCHNCNRALGLLKDNEEIIQKALDYIKENRV